MFCKSDQVFLAISDDGSIVDVPAKSPRHALLKAHGATDCGDFREEFYEKKYGEAIQLALSVRPGVAILKLGRWAVEEQIKQTA